MAQGTQSIVVACDGSEHSSNATRMAAELAEATGQPLKLLAVFPGTRLERLIVSGVLQSDIDKEASEYGRKVFDIAKQAASGIVEPAEEVLLKGDPAKELVEYLDENPGSHMFLGRRGDSMLRSLTLGSVSEKVVRHAHRPVTVVSE